MDRCIVDILSVDRASRYSLYPNPVIDYIYIEGEELEKITKIEIFDNLGHLVKVERLNEGHINTADLPSGQFFLRIHTYNDISALSFMK